MKYLYIILLLSLSQIFRTFRCQALNSTGIRIVGGDNYYAPVPYQLSFQRLSRKRWRHFCSGSIISADFFLTAAHCVSGEDPKRLSVLAGITSLKSSYGSRHYIQGYKMHDEFELLQKCDIALVKVFPPFQLNQMTINAINFMDTTPVGGGIPVTLTGWGSQLQSGAGPLPDSLQVLTTNTLHNSECRQKISKLKGTEICTFRANKKGACNGDSGGPLASYDGTKLVGIVSYGTRVCASGYPDVFTRVSEFVVWIVAKMVEPFP